MAKKTSFAKKYIVFLLILFLLVFACLGVIWMLMKNYQDGFHETETRQEWLLSQTAFEEYVSGMSDDDWVELWFATYPRSMDTRETVKSVLAERLSGSTNFARAKGYSDEAPVYAVEDENGAIAHFSLEKDADENWQVTASTMRMTGTESGSITVPSSCSVFCGDTQLDESCVTDSQKYYSMESSFGSDVAEPVTLLTYTVNGLLAEPMFTTQLPDGAELAEDYDGKPVVVLKSGAENVVDQCRKFFDDYMYYCMLGYYDAESHMRTAASHCRKESQAANVLATSLSEMRGGAPCYSNYKADVSTGPVIVWAGNALSVDIVFNAEGYYRDEPPYVQKGILRVHVVDYGNGYEICGIENKVME